MTRALKQAARLRASSGTSPADLTTPLVWTELGPHPIGSSAFDWTYYGGAMPMAGRVTAIAPHPTNANIVYVGTANGGVWKTVDSGTNWAPLFDDQPSLAIGALAIDPNNPSVVYAGTGEANGCCGSYFGAGLFKSVDAGAKWNKIGGATFDTCVFSGIVIKPGDSNTIIVGVHGIGKYTTCSNNNNAGLYRTTNGGADAGDWSRVQTGQPTEVAVAPNASSVLYAGFQGFGIWKSTNFGTNWNQLAGGLPTTSLGRASFDVVPTGGISTSQTIYAAIGTNTSYLAGVYLSTDGGAHWASLSSVTGLCSSEAGQCNYDLTVAIDPLNPSRAFVGGTILSRYNGVNPVQVGSGQVHWDNHASAFDASDRFWIGNDGGVYRSDDGGQTFLNRNKDLGITQFYPGLSGTLATSLLAGAQDNGSDRFTGSSSWRLMTGGDGGYAVVNPGNPNVLYTTIYYARIYKFVNGVQCPDFAVSGITRDKSFIFPLVGDPSRPKVMYVGLQNGTIYKTNTADFDLMQRHDLEPHQHGFHVLKRRQELLRPDHVARPDGHRGSDGLCGHVRRTCVRDARLELGGFSTNLPGRTVTDFAVDPSNAAIAYATVSGFNQVTSGRPPTTGSAGRTSRATCRTRLRTRCSSTSAARPRSCTSGPMWGSTGPTTAAPRGRTPRTVCRTRSSMTWSLTPPQTASSPRHSGVAHGPPP